jgi:hypothetical protein
LDRALRVALVESRAGKRGDAMSRGRRVPPPPFVQVGTTNPPIEEMARSLRGQVGLFMLRYEHDDGCPTPSSQRWDDCTCQEVDHRLLRFVDERQTQR